MAKLALPEAALKKKKRRLRLAGWYGFLIDRESITDWEHPKCEMCGKRFLRRTIYSRCCGARCITDDYLAKRTERRKAARQKQCKRCDKDFLGTRSDAEYCESACRQAAYRERVTGNSSGNLP